MSKRLVRSGFLNSSDQKRLMMSQSRDKFIFLVLEKFHGVEFFLFNAGR